jgi:hypothetical protein
MMNNRDKQRLVPARITVGIASLAVAGVVIGVFQGMVYYHSLVKLYAAILLLPFLFGLYRRGAILWTAGFKRVPREAGWRLYGGTLLTFLSLTVLLYSFEYWRGKRLYAKLAREVEARGESLDLRRLIPPPVPDDQNFCATPLLAAITDYEWPAELSLLSDQKRWHNPATVQRLQAIQLPNLTPKPRNWSQAKLTDLKRWQDRLAEDTHFPAATSPEKPAAGVLRALSRFDTDLAELRIASQRPHARWALPYDNACLMQVSDGDRLLCVRNLVSVLKLRAAAQLALGEAGEAWEDVKLSLHLAGSLKGNPSFHAHWVRNKLLTTTLQPVWEGLVTHRWTENQLADLQTRLGQPGLPADWPSALRGEIFLLMDMAGQIDSIFSLSTITTHFRELLPDALIIPYTAMWLFYPTGWQYLDQVYLYRFYERAIAAETAAAANPARASAGAASHRLFTLPVDPLLAIFVVPRLEEMAVDKTSFEITDRTLQQASLACALERYRLAHGQYPATLDDLTPRFIERLPRKPGTSESWLAYRRIAGDRFLLYPSGMTSVPDTWQDKGDRQNHDVQESGDGVWRFPAP